MARKRRVFKNVETEYERLGVEPKEAGRSLLHDDAGLPKVPRRRVAQMPAPDPLPSKPVSVKASNIDVPEQKFAHVGIHHQKLWHDNERQLDMGDSFDKGDEFEEIDTDAMQGHNSLSPETEVFMDDMDHEQRMAHGRTHDHHHVHDEEAQSEEEILLNDVLPLEYALLLDDEIVETNRDGVVIKNTIEDMVLKHNLDLNRIKVFRRVPIDFGVIIGD